MSPAIYSALAIAITIVGAPLVLGVIQRTKALFAGRRGAPLLQLYFDLARLARKSSVFSRTTTWVFRAGPAVGLATVLVASALVPLAGGAAPLAFEGDVVVLAYLLGLGRFFTVAAALDTGSAFEGMGAVREATFACLTEPAFLLGLVVLASASGSMSLSVMLGESIGPLWRVHGASLVLVLVSLFVVLLAESSRVPFDDPSTHLELTMIHEVMVLDHSGPALAMILYGAAVKLVLLGSVIVRVAIPVAPGSALGLAAFVAGLFTLAVLVGVVESTMARLRMLQVPNLLVGASILSALGIILLAR
ncbi:NADH-quinone oxidoreductase subunit H [Myxococcota bacterium]|nr:NADH-quinone oxidoreductase subunit H [Myxococcota bacterium]